MEQLQAQLAELEAKKAHLFEQDSVDQLEVSRLNERIKTLKSQIDDATREKQQRAEMIEEKVNATDVPFSIIGVDLSMWTPEMIAAVEAIHKAGVRSIYAAHAEEVAALKAEVNRHKLIAQADTARICELQEEVESWTEQHAKDAALIQKLELDVRDIENKRDAAVKQAEEKDAEIDRLNSLVDDYQKAKVLGEREAQKVIEVEQSEVDKINDLVRKAYVSLENWGSTNKVVKPDGTFELVKNADLHEWVPETEVTGQNSFRDESNQTTKTDTENSGVLDTEALSPPGLSFPGQEAPNENIIDGLDEGNASGEMVAEGPVTREEFKALKARVIMLENNQYIGSTFKSA